MVKEAELAVQAVVAGSRQQQLVYIASRNQESGHHQEGKSSRYHESCKAGSNPSMSVSDLPVPCLCVKGSILVASGG